MKYLLYQISLYFLFWWAIWPLPILSYMIALLTYSCAVAGATVYFNSL